jgi:protein-tyrosine phosphatase
MMRIVLPNRLWIGNAREARDLKSIHDAGIEAVVDLAANEAPAVLSRDIIYCRIPLVDGDGNPAELLRLAVSTLAQLVKEGLPTLVACSHGMSRSPTVVAFALARLQGIAPMEAAAITGGSISPVMWEATELAMREKE